MKIRNMLKFLIGLTILIWFIIYTDFTVLRFLSNASMVPKSFAYNKVGLWVLFGFSLYAFTWLSAIVYVLIFEDKRIKTDSFFDDVRKAFELHSIFIKAAFSRPNSPLQLIFYTLRYWILYVTLLSIFFGVFPNNDDREVALSVLVCFYAFGSFVYMFDQGKLNTVMANLTEEEAKYFAAGRAEEFVRAKISLMCYLNFGLTLLCLALLKDLDTVAYVIVKDAAGTPFTGGFVAIISDWMDGIITTEQAFSDWWHNNPWDTASRRAEASNTELFKARRALWLKQIEEAEALSEIVKIPDVDFTQEDNHNNQNDDGEKNE